MKRFGEPSLAVRVAIVALLWMTYPFVFEVLHDGVLNDMAATYSVVPAFLTIWMFGLRAAYAVAALIMPSHMLLFGLNGHGGGWDLLGGVAGFIGLGAVALGGLAFGFVVDRLRTTENHLAATDRRMSVVAHELRNPLAGVLGLAQTLVDTWDDLEKDEARTLAEMIAGEARTLSAIVADLLDVGRVRHQTLKVVAESVDLAHLITGIFPDAHVTEPTIAWADPLRVGQVVRNLVANAESHGSPPIEVAVWSNAGESFVEVRDAGAGVPPEVEDRLFGPFVTAGGPASTGLGLWLSRALAEAMGGSLDYGRTGGWTRFRLALPNAPASPLTENLHTLVRGSPVPD